MSYISCSSYLHVSLNGRLEAVLLLFRFVLLQYFFEIAHNIIEKFPSNLPIFYSGDKMRIIYDKRRTKVIIKFLDITFYWLGLLFFSVSVSFIKGIKIFMD